MTGTIRAADVIGPTNQGSSSASSPAAMYVVAARIADNVNVHSTLYPGGEIRSQLDNHRHSGHHHH